MAPLWWREGLNLDKAHLVLIGFSKGCVVLNQFIYEFHYLKTLTPDDDTMMRLVSRIQDMYWLDGGHAGGKNTWITSRSLLETLTRLGKLFVYISSILILHYNRLVTYSLHCAKMEILFLFQQKLFRRCIAFSVLVGPDEIGCYFVLFVVIWAEKIKTRNNIKYANTMNNPKLIY